MHRHHVWYDSATTHHATICRHFEDGGQEDRKGMHQYLGHSGYCGSFREGICEKESEVGRAIQAWDVVDPEDCLSSHTE